MEALDVAPKGPKPLLIGDLNANLDFPLDRQEEILTADLGERRLRCATRSFHPRRTRLTRTLDLAAAADTAVGGPD